MISFNLLKSKIYSNSRTVFLELQRNNHNRFWRIHVFVVFMYGIFGIFLRVYGKNRKRISRKYQLDKIFYRKMDTYKCTDYKSSLYGQIVVHRSIQIINIIGISLVLLLHSEFKNLLLTVYSLESRPKKLL